MKKIIDIDKQCEHLKKCAYILHSQVETLYFKEYILNKYKHIWHVLCDNILNAEKQNWIDTRKTNIYDFELLID